MVINCEVGLKVEQSHMPLMVAASGARAAAGAAMSGLQGA
jgi:hypothetical protein